jgi:hypothetical protein
MIYYELNNKNRSAVFIRARDCSGNTAGEAKELERKARFFAAAKNAPK